ncbi:hypothetical protein WA1_33525 [Scytonema hofmannii PCC 7110]|uniref:DUF1003 domain-containing protein n=1 Tax=Scytonema hofmannii PCC 7110 TaxID=128403 RepID=A0A139X2J4_9CYAN|nr:DUF1003 domain-containing protein [Scytonema hofmannii]KYC38927.1 hypothetical protein WA1_33525 [Scytonema hofmannii PCC 7110]
MKLTQKTLSNTVNTKLVRNSSIVEKQQSNAHNVATEELTPGQRLADKLAAQVGSWGFLIGQSAILAGWVGINSIPGLPHWDESPFMMLNLVFSFASAYTAPVVLMSQNRQSDTDRKNAEIDHQVNLRAGQNIELLHEKLDEFHARKLNELTQIIKEQQQAMNEIKVALVTESQEVKVHLVTSNNAQTNHKFLSASHHRLLSAEQKVEDDRKVAEELVRW